MSDTKTTKIAIFGAAGGIGSELSRRLTRSGRRLALIGRNERRLSELAAELDAAFFVADAADAESAEAAVAAAADRMGGLDGAVNCVGSIFLRAAHRTSPEEFRAVIDANLATAFHLVRSAAPRLVQAGGGSIVLISSAAARVGLPNHDAMAAAKAGVVGLTLSAAATYARQGVRVNCVAPGLVETPLSAGIIANPQAREASEKMHPLGRIGRPADVAAAIEWLLDPENSWVTGQVLGLDGGLSALRSR